MTDELVMIERVEWIRDLTVQELFDWCVQRGLQFERVKITATHLKFRTPQTPEEAERRRVAIAAQEARTLEWERATYQRLKAQFKTDGDQMSRGADYNTETFTSDERQYHSDQP